MKDEALLPVVVPAMVPPKKIPRALLNVRLFSRHTFVRKLSFAGNPARPVKERAPSKKHCVATTLHDAPAPPVLPLVSTVPAPVILMPPIETSSDTADTDV